MWLNNILNSLGVMPNDHHMWLIFAATLEEQLETYIYYVHGS